MESKGIHRVLRELRLCEPEVSDDIINTLEMILGSGREYKDYVSYLVELEEEEGVLDSLVLWGQVRGLGRCDLPRCCSRKRWEDLGMSIKEGEKGMYKLQERPEGLIGIGLEDYYSRDKVEGGINNKRITESEKGLEEIYRGLKKSLSKQVKEEKAGVLNKRGVIDGKKYRISNELSIGAKLGTVVYIYIRECLEAECLGAECLSEDLREFVVQSVAYMLKSKYSNLQGMEVVSTDMSIAYSISCDVERYIELELGNIEQVDFLHIIPYISSIYTSIVECMKGR